MEVELVVLLDSIDSIDLVDSVDSLDSLDSIHSDKPDTKWRILTYCFFVILQSINPIVKSTEIKGRGVW